MTTTTEPSAMADADRYREEAAGYRLAAAVVAALAAELYASTVRDGEPSYASIEDRYLALHRVATFARDAADYADARADDEEQRDPGGELIADMVDAELDDLAGATDAATVEDLDDLSRRNCVAWRSSGDGIQLAAPMHRWDLSPDDDDPIGRCACGAPDYTILWVGGNWGSGCPSCGAVGAGWEVSTIDHGATCVEVVAAIDALHATVDAQHVAERAAIRLGLLADLRAALDTLAADPDLDPEDLATGSDTEPGITWDPADGLTAWTTAACDPDGFITVTEDDLT